eukprot:Skav224317  [mRNA]  locus=scaffold227:486315:487049:+ [translate_table: standard]
MGAALQCCPATESDELPQLSVSFQSTGAADAVAVPSDVADVKHWCSTVCRLRQQLPAQPIICLLGSTTFNDPNTEERVIAIAKVLRERGLRNRASIVTGGMTGVQLTFAKHFQGKNLFQLLPEGKESGFPHGQDISAGVETHEERQELFGLIGDLYLSVEGGPGVAKEARLAANNGACVIPLMSSGGASGGRFDFPEQCFEKPPWAPQSAWKLLKKEEVAANDLKAAVAELMELYLDHLQQSKT